MSIDSSRAPQPLDSSSQRVQIHQIQKETSFSTVEVSLDGRPPLTITPYHDTHFDPHTQLEATLLKVADLIQNSQTLVKPLEFKLENNESVNFKEHKVSGNFSMVKNYLERFKNFLSRLMPNFAVSRGKTSSSVKIETPPAPAQRESPKLKEASALEAKQALDFIQTLRKAKEKGEPTFEVGGKTFLNFNGQAYQIPEKDKYGITSWKLTINGQPFEINEFDQGAYHGVKTEGFLKRQELLAEAAELYLTEMTSTKDYTIGKNKEKQYSEDPVITKEQKEELMERIKRLETQYVESIKADCQIDPDKIQSDHGDTYYQEIHKVAEQKIAQLATDISYIIRSSIPPGTNRPAFNLKKLAEYEKKQVLERGRPTIINTFYIDKGNGEAQQFVSMQTPLSKTTLPSTIRDREGLANYVRTSFGVLDANHHMQVLYSGIRHSSYPPIAIADSYKRQAIATQNVRQGLIDAAQNILQNTDIKTSPEEPLEVPLRSMILLTAKQFDFVRNKSYGIMGKWKGESETTQLEESAQALRLFNNRVMQIEIEGKEVWIKPNISFMNLGANIGATNQSLHGILPDASIQAGINARGFNALEEDVYEWASAKIKELEGEVSVEVLSLLENIIHQEGFEDKSKKQKDLQADLDGRLSDLYEKLEMAQSQYLHSNAPAVTSEINKIQAEISSLEKQLDATHKALLDARTKAFRNKEYSLEQNLRILMEKDPEWPDETRTKVENLQQVLTLHFEAQKIFHYRKFREPEHVMDFQVAYNLLQEKMGHVNEFFCKSAEDRTGRIDDKMQENLVFLALHGRFPNEGDSAMLQTYATAIHQYSASQNNTEQNSNARGEQIGAKINPGIPAKIGKLHAVLAKQIFKKAKKLKPSEEARLPSRMP
ncbi:hypothetical protein [Parachlamydia sp. AcF125]|uniref:hypothetical protein n=1 Tax=Parachlamydia sp. AcF125 TaxID=2795736 RepID=UPI001BC98D02|nr:hypothetical protein [Parachlamydia sp. AcF125]MBS4168212.1 hypothetical protein [Parachlamydia sp. AcF125]